MLVPSCVYKSQEFQRVGTVKLKKKGMQFVKMHLLKFQIKKEKKQNVDFDQLYIANCI